MTPPHVNPKWVNNGVTTQADLISYNQIREVEEAEFLGAMLGGTAISRNAPRGEGAVRRKKGH